MFNRLMSAAVSGCLLMLAGSPAFAYYSKDSYEAEVSFESNWGSFTGGTAYLFVVDANGVPSAGYPVTLE